MKLVQEIFVHEFAHIVISNNSTLWQLVQSLGEAKPSDGSEDSKTWKSTQLPWHDFIIFNMMLYLLNMSLYWELTQGVNPIIGDPVSLEMYMLLETQYFRSERNLLTFFDDPQTGTKFILHRDYKKYTQLLGVVRKELESMRPPPTQKK